MTVVWEKSAISKSKLSLFSQNGLCQGYDIEVSNVVAHMPEQQKKCMINKSKGRTLQGQKPSPTFGFVAPAFVFVAPAYELQHYILLYDRSPWKRAKTEI